MDVKQDDSQPTAASEHDAKMIKNVLMIGASGEVGGAVARSVVAGGHKLHALLRREVTNKDHLPDGVRQTIIDMSTSEGIEAKVAEIAAAEKYDAAISAVGIGSGSRTMSEADLVHIEVGVVGGFARGARKSGIDDFLLLTAVGTFTENSWFKQFRAAAKKVKSVRGNNFARVANFKPGAILGNKHTPRWVHVIWPKFTPYGTIHQEVIGQSFCAHLETPIAAVSPNTSSDKRLATKEDTDGCQYFEYFNADMEVLAKQARDRK